MGNNKKTIIKKNATAKLFFLRTSPQKVMLVADLIRSKEISKAIIILKHCQKRVAEKITNLLQSCISNAVNNHGLNAERLYVHKILVQKGTILKRMRPRAKGRSDRILKRCSNVMIELQEATI